MNEKLSDFIRIKRLIKKHTQQSLADKIGVTRQTYANWEENPIEISISKLLLIQEALEEDILIFFSEYVANCN